MSSVNHLFVSGWQLRRRMSIFLNSIGVDGQDFLTVGDSSMLLEDTLTFLLSPNPDQTQNFVRTKDLFSDLGTDPSIVWEIISRSCNYLDTVISELTGVPFEKFVIYCPVLHWEYVGAANDIHIFVPNTGSN